MINRLLTRFAVNAQFRLRSPASHLVTAGLLFAACSDSPSGPQVRSPEISGNPAQGLHAFTQECASCHTAADAFDLAFFAFPDTTIVRRAVAHVDTATAHDIVAYVRTLRTVPSSRDHRLFQPGGRAVSGDVEFATGLFGVDRWPEDMTEARLSALDPVFVPVGIGFPVWSVESSNLDWMPGTPLAPALLDYPTSLGQAGTRLEEYYANRSIESLVRVVQALRLAERDPENPDAPCVMEPFERFRPQECFETRRWISTLAAQHLLRTRVTGGIHPVLHDAWWDVGNAARRSRQTDDAVANSLENWAQWMYVGWAFEPDRHASVYLGLALDALGMPRHATFHALRAMIVRAPNSQAPFTDVRNAARFSPPHWTYDAVRFGFEHLIDRLADGIALREDQIEEARQAVIAAYTWSLRKESVLSRRTELLTLMTRVLQGIDALDPVISG